MSFDSHKLLDKTGWELLRLLQENARLSFAELGKQVGLTAPGVADRIHRMEDAGIITRYRVDIDLSKIGLSIKAIMRVTSSGPSSRFADIARQIVEIQECHRVTGSDCFILKVAVSSTAHLEALIDSFEPYGHVTTMLILSTPVADRLIGPDMMEAFSRFGLSAED
jgi:Lrp/AsnC family transcriptional regulator, leucine-responsive regulatory protein